MASLSMRPDWTLVVTTPELRLILKALGGRLKPEDIETAEALGDHLTAMRAHITANTMHEVDKLMSNIT